ncbi:hypothetical protein FB451DRAFT_1513143 [Mycena latifolia]|nr:hypothetical protein FB451DRAFT_1513143 [Mycena latifolia]
MALNSVYANSTIQGSGAENATLPLDVKYRIFQYFYASSGGSRNFRRRKKKSPAVGEAVGFWATKLVVTREVDPERKAACWFGGNERGGPRSRARMQQLRKQECVGLAKSVRIAALKQLDAEVSASTRLYMLHDRREPLEDEPAKKITAVLRWHYLLLVVNPKHRKALTRLLVSQHPLAVERMRYKQRYHRVIVPRDERLCRFGWRRWSMHCSSAEVQRVFWNAGNTLCILLALIFCRDTVCQIAKFAWKVFAIFDAVPMLRIHPGMFRNGTTLVNIILLLSSDSLTYSCTFRLDHSQLDIRYAAATESTGKRSNVEEEEEKEYITAGVPTRNKATYTASISVYVYAATQITYTIEAGFDEYSRVRTASEFETSDGL